MGKAWYLYQDKSGHRWWSDWPPEYQWKSYKLIAFVHSEFKPTRARCQRSSAPQQPSTGGIEV